MITRENQRFLDVQTVKLLQCIAGAWSGQVTQYQNPANKFLAGDQYGDSTLRRDFLDNALCLPVKSETLAFEISGTADPDSVAGGGSSRRVTRSAMRFTRRSRSSRSTDARSAKPASGSSSRATACAPPRRPWSGATSGSRGGGLGQ